MEYWSEGVMGSDSIFQYSINSITPFILVSPVGCVISRINAHLCRRTKVRWRSRSSHYPLAGENGHPVGAGSNPSLHLKDKQRLFTASVTRDDAKVVIPNIVRDLLA